MKKFLLFISTLLIALTFSSCEDSSANYYVRYTLSPTYGHLTKYAIALEDGSLEEHRTGNVGQDRTLTIGPVNNGFTARIVTYSEERYCTCTIEVCKGTEPFVRKAYGQGSIYYTIDF